MNRSFLFATILMMVDDDVQSLSMDLNRYAGR